MQEMFDGWAGLAEYLDIPEEDVRQYAMNDIVLFGEELGLKWSPSGGEVNA